MLPKLFLLLELAEVGSSSKILLATEAAIEVISDL